MLTLTDYCRINSVSDKVATNLIDMFRQGYPIATMYHPTTGWEPEWYNEPGRREKSHLSGVVGALASKILISFIFAPETKEYFIKTFGIIPDSSENKCIHYLFLQAARYRFFHQGACSLFASYASLYLAHYLPGANITVVSNPRKDHYFMHIGTEYIYDPLVNPEILFLKKDYTMNVLRKLPDSIENGKPFKLKITNAHAQLFNKQWPSIRREFLSTIQRTHTTVRELMSDPMFINILIKNRVNKAPRKALIVQAIEAIQNLVKEQAADPLGVPAFGEEVVSSSSSNAPVPSPEDVVAALKQLSGVEEVKFYLKPAQVLITLTHMDKDQVNNLMTRLFHVNVMKVELLKLKGTETLVIRCTNIDEKRLLVLMPTTIDASSLSPGASSSSNDD
ncbi:MAG: hypothetical protein ACHQUC_03905 [Chlamydiales bacterium]